jgi:membrane protein
LGKTTFTVVFFCACALFLTAVGYFALGVLAKFYAFIKFAVRICLQDPKFSLAMLAPAFILSLYIVLVSQNIIFNFTWGASANIFGGPASGLLLDVLLFGFSLIARLEERYFYVFSFRLALLELLCGLITAIISRDIFSIYVPCAQILLVFCVRFDFLCLSAAKANAKLLEELSAKKDLREPENLAKEALERLANLPDKEEALLQANLIRMKMKQEYRTA